MIESKLSRLDQETLSEFTLHLAWKAPAPTILHLGMSIMSTTFVASDTFEIQSRSRCKG